MARFLRVGLFAALLILPVSLIAQQVSQTPPAPVRDPQAIALLTQCLTMAGGTSALTSVRDFTATGKVTYYWASQEVTGTVTVKSRGLGQFRVEATLAEGVRTMAVDNGTAWLRNSDGTVQQLFDHHTDNAGSAYFPFQEISAALSDHSINITDLGMVTEDGQQLHGVRLQTMFAHGGDPGGRRSKLSQRDIFIDPNTFTVVRTRDLLPLRSQPDPHIAHDVIFSNYRLLNGVLFPYSVTETVNHQQTTKMQFDKLTFNGGLGDTDFKQ